MGHSAKCQAEVDGKHRLFQSHMLYSHFFFSFDTIEN